MRQFFYVVAHTIVGDDQVIDKVFLQDHDAIRWGRTLATKHPECTVSLYRQAIARTSTVEYVKELTPYPNLKPNANPVEPFDWSKYETIDWDQIDPTID